MQHQRWSLYLLLIFIYNVVGTSEFLNRALRGINFTLPTHPFDIPIPLGPKLHCELQLKCTNIQIQNLKVDGNFRSEKYEFKFGLEGVASNCFGVLSYAFGKSEKHPKQIGLEIILTKMMLKASWRAYWDSNGSDSHLTSLPHKIALKHSKVKLHLNRAAFHVIGPSRTLSKMEDLLLNLLAPEFGSIVLDPVLQSSLGVGTVFFNHMLQNFRHKVEHLFQKEIPEDPLPIETLEARVYPNYERFGVNDSVVPLDNPYVHYVSQLVSSLLAKRNSKDGEMVLNKLIVEHLLENGPGSDWVIWDQKTRSALPLIEFKVSDIEFALYLVTIRIQGIDSFEEFRIADVIGNFSIRNHIKFSQDVKIKLTGILSQDSTAGGKLDERFELVINAHETDLLISVLAAMDRSGIQNVSFGSYFGDMTEFVDCLMTAFDRLIIAEMEMGHTRLTRFLFRGTDEIFDYADSLMACFWTVFGQPLWYLFSTRSSSIAQHVMESFFEDYQSSNTCVALPWPPPEMRDKKMVEWDRSLIAKFAGWFVNDFIGTNGDFSVNAIIDFTLGYIFPDEWTDSSLRLQGTFFDTGRLDLNQYFPFLEERATASIQLGNLSITGLDQIVNLAILQVVRSTPSNLYNWIAFGDFGFKIDLLIDIVGILENTPSNRILDQISIDFSIDARALDSDVSLAVFANLFLEVVQNIWRFFTPKTLASTCAVFLLPPPPAARELYTPVAAPLSFRNISFSTDTFSLMGKCISCSSPELGSILEFFSDPSSQEQLQQFVKRELPQIERMLTNTSSRVFFGGANTNHALNAAIAYLRQHCLGIPIPKPDDPYNFNKPWWLPPMKIVVAIIALLTFTIFVYTMMHTSSKSSTLRDDQSKRLATHLLQNDFLPSPSATFQHSRDDAGGTLFSDWFTSAIAQGESSVDIGTPRDEDRATLTITPIDTPVGEIGDVSPINSESSPLHHKAVVSEFQRRAKTCLHSRNSILQSPREIVSESDALYLLGHDESMYNHPSINKLVRISMVMLLCVNYLLFITGNFFHFGQVLMIVRFAGNTFKKIPVVEFSIDYAVDLMEESGSILTGFLIGSCSGVLPWFRVACLGYAWLAPPNVLSVEHRGYLLLLMESCGKWTMAVFYFSTLLVATLSTSVALPPQVEGFLPSDAFSMDVGFHPQWGLLSFIMSSLLCTILNHVILYYHDCIRLHNIRTMEDPYHGHDHLRPLNDDASGFEEDQHEITPVNQDESEFILSGTPGCSNESGFMLDTFSERSCLTNFMISVGLLLWPIVFVFAHFTNLFIFQFVGLARFTLTLMGGQQAREASLISLAASILNEESFHMTNTFVLVFLFLTYVILVLVAPAALITMANLLWFGPHLGLMHRTGKMRYRTSVLYRTLISWNLTVVVVVCVLVIVNDLPRLFDTIANQLPFCPHLMNDYIYMIGGSPEESVCFGVDTGFDFGMIPVLIYAAYSAMMGNIIYRMKISPDSQFWVTI